MAQPTNTFDSFSAVGAREDLSNIIYNVDPYETPLYTSLAKTKASNHLHEWQTDVLRASAENKHIEGDDTVAVARTPTTRLGNYSQILKEAVVVPDSDRTTNKAGRSSEMAYQLGLATKAVRLDVEKALFANNARVAGSSTVAAELAGMGAWIATNTSVASAGAPSDPTGDGTDARTDGTKEPFTQERFDTVMQEIWVSGGKPDCVMLSAFQMDVALGFTGNNAQRSTIEVPTSGNRNARYVVSNMMNVYITPWGTVDFIPCRENRSRDVFILQKEHWAVAEKRPFQSTRLAKTGDNEKEQIVGELTLVSRNEKSSGGVFDNTDS